LAAALPETRKLLILGGTGEAVALADLLAEDPRLTVITSLAGDFNPRLLRAIADLAEAQRRDSEWIHACVEAEAQARFRSEGPWLSIESEGWKALPEALARRVAREALRRGGGARDVDAEGAAGGGTGIVHAIDR